MLDSYIDDLTRLGRTSAHGVANVLDNHVKRAFPELLCRKANEIGPGDIQMILARLVNLGRTRQVNKTRSYLHAAFSHGGKQDNDPRRLAADHVVFELRANPAVLVPRIAEFDRVGDRVLSKEELRLFWAALDDASLVQASFWRFNLALGGQRIEQLLRAEWRDYDLDSRILTLRDSKGRPGLGTRDHLLPLTDWARRILEPMRELNGEEIHPFCSAAGVPMVASTLSKVVQTASRKLTQEFGLEPFRGGDIRRTCETLLASIGISKEVRAQLLSHGRSSGIQARHYDRWAYLPEKEAALNDWEKFLDEDVHVGIDSASQQSLPAKEDSERWVSSAG